MSRAFITGITGQDGSYLAELLLEKSYEVHGAIRPDTGVNNSRIAHLIADPLFKGRLSLHRLNLADASALAETLARIAPDEVYHLAGQSHIGLSYEIPEATCEFTTISALRLLGAMRAMARPPRCFHASSSAVFGRPTTFPQDELTPIAPVSPYGCAKAFATHLVRVYRDSYSLFACNGIMYNHESPRRGTDFVTRKICHAAAAIRAGMVEELRLGDLEAKRDWGHARDYVKAMWLMLQQEQPDDYIIATGELHSVTDVLDIAFGTAGLDWRPHVRQDPKLVRPKEPVLLVGNAGKARMRLGWTPTVSFREMIREMTIAEMLNLKCA